MKRMKTNSLLWHKLALLLITLLQQTLIVEVGAEEAQLHCTSADCSRKTNCENTLHFAFFKAKAL